MDRTLKGLFSMPEPWPMIIPDNRSEAARAGGQDSTRMMARTSKASPEPLLPPTPSFT
jgi:hypothetical protein